MYRWLGCRGCISDCVTVPLDQVVAIWNRYQTVLLGYKNKTEDMNDEKRRWKGIVYTFFSSF